MGLLSYDPMEDGDVASGNLWNVRLSAIHDLLNGNIDAANLANNAVTTAKIAENAVTYEKLADDIFGDLVNTASNPGTAAGTFSYINLGGVKIAWGTCQTSASEWKTINYTDAGFTAPPVLTGNTIEIAAPSGWVEFSSLVTPGSGSPTSTGCALLSRKDGGNAATTVMWMAIGQ